MAQSVLNIIIRTLARGSGTQDTVKDLKKLTTGLETGINVVGGFVAAYYGINQVLDKTVGQFTTYADAVRKVNTITGAGYEESSRLIQVFDDMGISTEDMTRSLQFAAKQGIPATVESLAKLSDQYNTLEPGVARVQFLMDKFGKTGVDMARVMDLGSAAIRENAASVNQNLILNEQAVQSAKEYQLAMDDLSDAAQGLAISLGRNLAPVLTNAAHGLDMLLTFHDKVQASVERGAQSVMEESKSYEEYVSGLKQVADAGTTAITVTYALTDAQAEQVEKTRPGAHIIRVMSEEEYNAAKAAGTLAQATTEVTDAQTNAVPGTEEWTASLERAKAKMAELGMLMSTDITDAHDRFIEKTASLAEEEKKLNDQIAQLESRQYLTSAQRSDLEGLKQNLSGVKAEEKKVGETFDQESKRIIFNILQTRLAADGLSEAEADFLVKTAESFGLIDQNTAALYQNLDKPIALLNSGQTNAAYAALAKFFNLPPDMVYNVAVHVTTDVSGAGGTVVGGGGGSGSSTKGRATGGDTIVTSPTTFQVGEYNRPERVTVTPLMGNTNYHNDTYNSGQFNIGKVEIKSNKTVRQLLKELR